MDTQNQKPTKAAVYTRVSGENDNSMEDQLQHIKTHAEKTGTEVVREYADTQGSREQFTQMMTDATSEHAPFQQILVYQFNRFSRSLTESFEWRSKLGANGVTIVSVTEPA